MVRCTVNPRRTVGCNSEGGGAPPSLGRLQWGDRLPSVRTFRPAHTQHSQPLGESINDISALFWR